MLLLRHGSAGERLSSPGVDRFRRLDEAGRTVARRPGDHADRLEPARALRRERRSTRREPRPRRREPLGARARGVSERPAHPSRRPARHRPRLHAPRGHREASRLGRHVREGRRVGPRAKRVGARPHAVHRSAGSGRHRGAARRLRRLVEPAAPFPAGATTRHELNREHSTLARSRPRYALPPSAGQLRAGRADLAA
jgi:hypothetical protein